MAGDTEKVLARVWDLYHTNPSDFDTQLHKLGVSDVWDDGDGFLYFVYKGKYYLLKAKDWQDAGMREISKQEWEKGVNIIKKVFGL